MTEADVISRLIEAFRCLPGVGPKSAQRMAYHLLERDRDSAKILSVTLAEAADKVGNCSSCRNLTEDPVCAICSNPRRDTGVLCIVETPSDVQAIETAAGFQGRYFVLMGHLSPLDSIGPEEIGLDVLAKKLDEGQVTEVILATGSTVEGEATAHYIGEMVRARKIKASRIAQGVPLGGELEYVDRGTLSHAFSGRQEIS